jgi:hypothetical protein
VELYLHSFNTPSWRGAQFKTQGQLYLTFTHSKRWVDHVDGRGEHRTPKTAWICKYTETLVRGRARRRLKEDTEGNTIRTGDERRKDTDRGGETILSYSGKIIFG